MERIDQQEEGQDIKPKKKDLLITEVVDNADGLGASIHEINRQRFDGVVRPAKPINAESD